MSKNLPLLVYPSLNHYHSILKPAPSFLVTILCISLFLFSCLPPPESGSNNLVVGLETGPTQLDPRLSTDLVSSHISKMVYNGLLKVDSHGDLVPDLAEKWEMPDEITFIVHLRKGVRFHNDKELTSADIRFTLDTIMSPTFQSPRAVAYEALESMETPSPHKIVFRLKRPHAPFLYSLTQEIVPRPEKDFSLPNPKERPVGTGPFRFISYLPDEEVRLEPNPDYFEGPPKIKKLVFRIIPDETIRILELEKGNLHLLQNAFSPDLLPRLKKNDHLKIVQAPGTHYSYIGFNLEDPILRNRQVRAAIAFAIDRLRIAEMVLKGLVHPTPGPLSPMHWAAEPNLESYPYNPVLARKMLEEAGYPDPDGPGPLPRFALDYKTSQNELRKLIGEVLVQQLSEIGIQIKMRSYEWGTFYEDIKNGNFQMFTLTWVGIQSPDFFREAFHSQNIPPRGANRGRFKNKEIDDLTELAARTMDREQRKEIYSRVQKILALELPYVSLWHGVNVAVMDKNLEGFRVYPDESLAALREVYFQEK